jgi:MoaA/NifB/PqqE/SkfB family radical SAM enzyme
MTCAPSPEITLEWTTGFRTRAAERRAPISAVLELTRRCNLRCPHCYLGDQAEQHRLRGQERDAAAVKASLTEWAEAGCLYLLITGGDPLLRPDFAEIYRHARELGLVVTVFCNGTLVTDAIIALFCEFPPRKVEISLYGATAETYERATGVPGSHARAWAGIRRLQAAGIGINLKTILMTTNRHEMEAMKRQADEIGASFRHDAALFPCIPDGSRKPLSLRVKPEEAVQRDMATPESRRMWRENVERIAALPEDNRLYTCSAGLTFFHADPFGVLSPCLLAANYRYPAGARSFLDLWNGELAEIRQRQRTQPGGSFSGALRGACVHCPAFNHLETGDEEQESDYMKQTTLLRYQAAMSPETGGNP